MKILHVHQTLGIGGVETYLYRLCGGLVARGHQVGMLTGGGALEERVVAAGADLIKIRPQNENFEPILAAVENQNFDLVHAHNYRVAGFSKKLAAQIGAQYLLSVHGPRHLWQLLPFGDWSDIVVAMSEGDRDNISGLGGISKNRVRLSFYGIDTERFRPALEVSETKNEAGLDEKSRPIVYISRFSNRKAKVGFALLQALPDLREKLPSATVLMIGEGPEKANLSAKIEETNRKIDFEAARMIGPRADVEKWMNRAACVVATANTALEALSCGAPTIAAGRTGYFGPVSPENFEAGRALCFADHGKSPFRVEAGLLGADLERILSDETAPRVAGQVAAIVRDKYNVAQMTEGTEAIYREVLGA